jgi:hypothetical protein
MKRIASFGLFLVLSVGAGAQQHGTNVVVPRFRPQLFPPTQIPYRSPNNGFGFGNILFPGTGAQPSPTGTFVSSFGTNIVGGGYRGGRGTVGGGGILAYPIIGGYGYGGDNGNSYQQPAPNITIVMPPQQTGPAVTINQGAPPAGDSAAPSGGNVQSYQAPTEERPEPSDDQVLFFIALKDSSVYTAVAYWIEDGTLHYITPRGKHNQVSLGLVDRETSAKLNQGRKVEFRLPPAQP